VDATGGDGLAMRPLLEGVIALTAQHLDAAALSDLQRLAASLEG
jgi:hypothetical protein